MRLRTLRVRLHKMVIPSQSVPVSCRAADTVPHNQSSQIVKTRYDIREGGTVCFRYFSSLTYVYYFGMMMRGDCGASEVSRAAKAASQDVNPKPLCRCRLDAHASVANTKGIAWYFRAWNSRFQILIHLYARLSLRIDTARRMC